MIAERFNFGLKLFFIPKEGGCCVTNVCKLYHDDVFPVDHVIMCTGTSLIYSMKNTQRNTQVHKSTGPQVYRYPQPAGPRIHTCYIHDTYSVHNPQVLRSTVFISSSPQVLRSTGPQILRSSGPRIHRSTGTHNSTSFPVFKGKSPVPQVQMSTGPHLLLHT